jgi:hypothetical protein
MQTPQTEVTVAATTFVEGSSQGQPERVRAAGAQSKGWTFLSRRRHGQVSAENQKIDGKGTFRVARRNQENIMGTEAMVLRIWLL